MRTLAAASRAAQRDAERRNKQKHRAQVSAQASEAVEALDAHIDDILSLHVETADSINWLEISKQPPPIPPVSSSEREKAAAQKLAGFTPGLRHIFSGGSTKVRARLEAEVGASRRADLDEYSDRVRLHSEAMREWEADAALAKRVLGGDPKSYREVISELPPDSQNSLMGKQISYSFSHNQVHAMPHVHDIDVVPNMRRKQLASGKLSETKRPVGERLELYQDYVASVALRAAGDIFQILPLEEVYVTCLADMLDTKTGHKAWTPILSAQIVRSTFERLNRQGLDPSDAMGNFRTAQTFSRTKGFSKIEPLLPT